MMIVSDTLWMSIITNPITIAVGMNYLRMYGCLL